MYFWIKCVQEERITQVTQQALRQPTGSCTLQKTPQSASSRFKSIFKR